MSMTSSAFWVHSEASSAIDNNPCSEASHHGNSVSIVVMFCVSVPVLSEQNMSIPTSSRPRPACLHPQKQESERMVTKQDSGRRVELSLVGRHPPFPTVRYQQLTVPNCQYSAKQETGTILKATRHQANQSTHKPTKSQTSATKTLRKSDAAPPSSSLISQWPRPSSQPSPSRPPSLPPCRKQLRECRHNFQPSLRHGKFHPKKRSQDLSDELAVDTADGVCDIARGRAIEGVLLAGDGVRRTQ